MVMSETMTLLLVSATALAAFRLWRAPTTGRAVAFGVLGALAALTHPDQTLLLPLAGVPITFGLRRLTLRRRVGLLAAATVAALAVVSPWIVYNNLRFDRPVLLSTGLDITMAVSNCDETYHGPFRGFWYMPCASSRTPPPGDESVQAEYWRRLAFDYMRAHRDEVPGVIAARLGRIWGFYRPFQQLRLDVLEGHDLWVSELALGWYWTLLPLAVAGVVMTKRRGLPVSPFVGTAVIVTLNAVLTFGNTRYRIAAEVALAVCAAVALDALVSRLRRAQRAPGGAVVPEPELAPARGD
ncbi:MAG: hypothetical protein C4344_06225 [Acidimicrobiia bacterium]